MAEKEAGDERRETAAPRADAPARPEAGKDRDNEEQPGFKVEDRRHWALSEEEKEDEGGAGEGSGSRYPTVIDEYRTRTEEAERKLHEYIDAYKRSQQEQDRFRERLSRDVERRVELQFGGLLTDMFEALDDLDLALSHAEDAPEAATLAKGVAMVRDRFLDSLQRRGVEKIEPNDGEFDPNLAEAVRVEPVESPEQDGKVVETLRAGYRLGDHVIRPARVSVGKFTEQ